MNRARKIMLITALVALPLSVAAATGAFGAAPTVRTPIGIETNQLAIRPHRIYFSGDGTVYVGHLRWRSWGGKVAVARGTASLSTCEPDCVEGTRLTFPARVRLFKVVRCVGSTIYSKATYKLGGELPYGWDRKRTLPLTWVDSEFEPIC